MGGIGVSAEKEVDGETGGARCVDAEEGGAAAEGDGVENEGAEFGVGEGRSGRSAEVGEGGKPLGNHGFVGQGHEHGELGEAGDELGEAVEEFVVLVEGFGEAETRVEDDLVGAEGVEEVDFLLEVGGEVVDDVVVAGVFGQLHGGRGAAHVHKNIGDAEGGDGGEHLGVDLTAGDVVDDVGTGFDGTGGRETLAGVDRDEGVGEVAAEEGDERGEFLGLLVGRQDVGTGTRGHDTEVEDVGTVGKKLPGMGEKGLRCVVSATVVERVGGSVENAHDCWALEGCRTPKALNGERGKLNRIVHEWKKMCIFVFCM